MAARDLVSMVALTLNVAYPESKDEDNREDAYKSQSLLSNPITWPGRVAQSVGHLTGKLEVLGSIPGLAAYFRFSFR